MCKDTHKSRWSLEFTSCPLSAEVWGFWQDCPVWHYRWPWVPASRQTSTQYIDRKQNSLCEKNPQKHYKIPKLSFYISYRSIKSINLVAKYNLSLSTFSISVANCIFQNECRLYSQKADILEDFLSPQIKYLFQQKCIYICLLFYWQRSFYILVLILCTCTYLVWNKLSLKYFVKAYGPLNYVTYFLLQCICWRRVGGNLVLALYPVTCLQGRIFGYRYQWRMYWQQRKCK